MCVCVCVCLAHLLHIQAVHGLLAPLSTLYCAVSQRGVANPQCSRLAGGSRPAAFTLGSVLHCEWERNVVQMFTVWTWLLDCVRTRLRQSRKKDNVTHNLKAPEPPEEHLNL